MQTLLIVPIVSRKIREVVLLRNIGYDPFITYRPQTKLRKGNVFTSVCQQFCPQREGGVHPLGRRPLDRPPPRADPLGRHPAEQTHLPGQTPLPGRQSPW